MSSEENTPIERPCVEPANHGLVVILTGLSSVLADLARAICRAPQPVSIEHRTRIANALGYSAAEIKAAG